MWGGGGTPSQACLGPLYFLSLLNSLPAAWSTTGFRALLLELQSRLQILLNSSHHLSRTCLCHNKAPARIALVTMTTSTGGG